MANFKAMFPRLQTKRSLLSPSDLAELKGKANFMAAVDLYVITHADVAALTFHGQVTPYSTLVHFLCGAFFSISPQLTWGHRHPLARLRLAQYLINFLSFVVLRK
jgi:hypothetical protein